MAGDQDQDQERTPLGQILFDDIFLFFMLSLVISFVFYNLWGLLELLRLPFAGP
jgi:hypothetical protein